MSATVVTPAIATRELLNKKLDKLFDDIESGSLRRLSLVVVYNDQGWPRLVETARETREEAHEVLTA